MHTLYTHVPSQMLSVHCIECLPLFYLSVHIVPSLLCHMHAHIHIHTHTHTHTHTLTHPCRFTKRDEEGLLYSLHFCSSMLNNTLVYQRELALKKQNEVLLQVAKNLFTSLGWLDCNTLQVLVTFFLFCSDNLVSLLRGIMNAASSLTNAERCVWGGGGRR